MGDLSLADMRQVLILTAIVFPCFIIIFRMSHTMNILLMGKEIAMTMGVDVKKAIIVLLVASSLMTGAVVCHSGLLGFVGLVIPHLFRLVVGHDHRLLAPACVLGGGAYLTLCDLLARALPDKGEIPVGVITAMIGAPLFILLLKRTEK
jgi:iron complex transport system permease protein